MKLTAVHVREFKSIRDSGPFTVDDVTCLVGKNESGKTTVLQALYRLNPIIPEHGKFDITDDYPRVDVEDYRQSVESGKPHAVVVEAKFAIEPAEIDAIEDDFGKGVLKSNQVVITNGYVNRLNFALDVDEKIAGRYLLNMAGLSPEYPETGWQNLKELNSKLGQQAEQKVRAVAEAEAKIATIEDAEEKAKAADQKAQLAESNASKQLRSTLDGLIKNGLAAEIWTRFLLPKLPKFLYFDEYYQMEGQLNIEQLKARKAANALTESDRPMLGLIDLARLNLDELIQPTRTEALISKLEGASNHLSKQILKYWSQNKHVRVRFDVRPGRSGDPPGMQDGTNLLGRVDDSVHLVSTPLGTRSRGFVWFFSFLAWFSQQKKSGAPLILLLDEPGLFLHGKAQGDLLRYIEEELRPHHQVILTTHSPFMVDPLHFGRVRIVEDKSMDATEVLPVEQQGTKVSTDVLSVSEGSLFPLQGALGYELCQNLFVGPNSLVVEGVSDLLYIQTISAVLADQGKESLSAKWTITPVGGADKVPTFVALLGAQTSLNIATPIDVQNRDRQQIENLYKAKLLQKKQVLTFGDFTGKPEADIEDMFEPDFYVDLVNAEFAKAMAQPIGAASLTNVSQRRILTVLEELFVKAPLQGAKFNHYRPARYFAENVEALAPKLSNDTLTRFETAFRALNALLK